MAVVDKMGMVRPNEGGIIYSNLAAIGSGIGLANGDQSQPLSAPECVATKSVQITGTFGVGAIAQVEKSNDGTNFVVLAAGDVKSGTHPVTTASAAQLVEFVSQARLYRINVTAGDGTTSLFATMVLLEQDS